MTKFLTRWEVDPALIPADAEERAKLWLTMLEMVKANMKEGITEDWGMCSGELCGYSTTGECTEEELNTSLLQWMPYVKFKVNAVLTVDQTIASIKKAAESAKK